LAERKKFDQKLIKIGQMLESRRKMLGKKYATRESFIEHRSVEIFGGKPWISVRHLSNIELGKNWISIEKLIIHSYALEMDPVDLLTEILEIYNS